MDKEELLVKLRELAKKKKKKILTTKDIQSERKLHFFLYQHYDNVADALEDAGLEASILAKRMRMSDEEKLKNLYELGRRIGRIPRYKDTRKEGWYKIYQKFGGVKKAYEQALAKFGSPVKRKKLEKKLPEIDYKGLFYGSAAEYFVITELLYRGYIAQKMPIDLGLDVYATKGEKIFFFQVKNVSFDQSGIRHISITLSSFLKNESTRVFYIFVIQKSENKEALIIDYLTMRRLKGEGYIHEENEKTMMISFQKVGNSVFVFRKDNPKIKMDVSSYYLDDWDAIV